MSRLWLERLGHAMRPLSHMRCEFTGVYWLFHRIMLTFDSGKLLHMFFHHVIGVLNLWSCLMDVMIKMSNEVCLSEFHGDIISGCFIYFCHIFKPMKSLGEKRERSMVEGLWLCRDSIYKEMALSLAFEWTICVLFGFEEAWICILNHPQTVNWSMYFFTVHPKAKIWMWFREHQQ